MKTYHAKPGEVEREWLLIDATDQVLGRVATKAAQILKGKHKLLRGASVIVMDAGLPQEVLDQCWISVREPSLDKLLSFQLPHISSQTEDPVFQICPVDPGDWYLMRRRLRSPRLCPAP